MISWKRLYTISLLAGASLALSPAVWAEFGGDATAGLNLPTMLSGEAAAASAAGAGGSKQEKSGNYEVCARYAADIDADMGDIMRAGCKPTVAQMSKLMDNPIGNVAMMFNQYDGTSLKEPGSGIDEFKHNYMMLLQFPKKLNNDWNLINRFVFNYTSVPIEQSDMDDFVPPEGFGEVDYQSLYGGGTSTSPANTPLPVELFDGRTSDLGDSYYIGLFAPSDPVRLDNGAKFLWGAGFDLGFDTAAEDILGTGKWTAGPSALAVYMGETFKGGALVQQYWDYAGDGDRSSVNMTNIQTLYYWSLNETTSIGAGPNVIANWEQDNDNTWTVPVGIGLVKTIQFGKVPVRFGLEYHHSIIEPDDIPGADWNVRFYIIPAVPSALFSWMQ